MADTFDTCASTGCAAQGAARRSRTMAFGLTVRTTTRRHCSVPSTTSGLRRHGRAVDPALWAWLRAAATSQPPPRPPSTTVQRWASALGSRSCGSPSTAGGRIVARLCGLRPLRTRGLCGARPARPDESRTLVVASAGNTAAAFADACTVNDVPLVVIVPANAFDRVRPSRGSDPRSRSSPSKAPSTRTRSRFRASSRPMTTSFSRWGTQRGRRDGLGIVMLAAVEAIGTIPDYYFQAVGSAAGHSASAKRPSAGRRWRFGHQVPQLMLAQNAPFTPLYDAWSVGAPC